MILLSAGEAAHGPAPFGLFDALLLKPAMPSRLREALSHAFTTTRSIRCTNGFAGSPETSSLSPYFLGASLDNSHFRVSTCKRCFWTAPESVAPLSVLPTGVSAISSNSFAIFSMSASRARA